MLQAVLEFSVEPRRTVDPRSCAGWPPSASSPRSPCCPPSPAPSRSTNARRRRRRADRERSTASSGASSAAAAAVSAVQDRPASASRRPRSRSPPTSPRASTRRRRCVHRDAHRASRAAGGTRRGDLVSGVLGFVGRGGGVGRSRPGRRGCPIWAAGVASRRRHARSLSSRVTPPAAAVAAVASPTASASASRRGRADRQAGHARVGRRTSNSCAPRREGADRVPVRHHLRVPLARLNLPITLARHAGKPHVTRVSPRASPLAVAVAEEPREERADVLLGGCGREEPPQLDADVRGEPPLRLGRTAPRTSGRSRLEHGNREP